LFTNFCRGTLLNNALNLAISPGLYPLRLPEVRQLFKALRLFDKLQPINFQLPILMTLQDKCKQLNTDNKALLAVNFYNFETLSAVLRAASAQSSAIILQSTKSTIDYLGLEVTAKLARAAISQYEVEAWLHLDHAQDISLIQRALDAGYDS